ncbi:DUF6585 family protein [Zavarzinella formosa]|uniref:DUF6585 family protein n=1 Tax=Zavarzinella formosa TaxID=360055 RepID=UPI0003095A5C|nr:DUF6585 family protein [Zavarzinella formosa]
MISPETSSAFHAELPRELAAAVAGLGQPLGLYRTSPHMNFRRAGWGTVILLAGFITNIWFWVFAPQQRIVVLLAVIGIPLAGLTLLLALLRDRGIWVMRYPMGLLRWQRGEVMSLPWSEVTGMSLHGVTRCAAYSGTADDRGTPLTGWIPLDPVAERILGPVVRLYRADGMVADFPAALTEFSALSREIQEQVFRQHWPAVCGEFEAGNRLRFGLFVARNDGLYFAGSRLRWGLAEDAIIAGGQLQIRAKGLWKPWADAPLDRVLNPHILLALFLLADDIVEPFPNSSRENRDV